MGFEEAILKTLSKYAVFTGRARPSEFWWFMVLYASTHGLTVLTAVVAPALVVALLAVVLALTVPALAVTVRRLHDIGAAGWMLVFLIPVVGQALMVAWLTRPSVPRLNRFGPEPTKRRERLLLFAR